MKKLLVLAMMLALSTGAFASNLWLGGTISYNDSKNYNLGSDLTQQEFSVSPKIGFDINENWDLGLGLSFAYSDANNSSTDYSTRTTGINSFIRHKVFAVGSLDVLAAANIYYTYGNRTGNNGVDDLNAITRGYGVQIAPALRYNVNDSWKIVCIIDYLSLGYAHTETQGVEGDQSKADKFEFKANNGQFITLGLEYHF